MAATGIAAINIGGVITEPDYAKVGASQRKSLIHEHKNCDGEDEAADRAQRPRGFENSEYEKQAGDGCQNCRRGVHLESVALRAGIATTTSGSHHRPNTPRAA